VSRSFSWVPRRIDPIAIDFGSRFVRVMQLARHRSQATITAMGERALPPGPRTLQEHARLQADAAREILAEARFTGTDAICMLDWDETRFCTLRLPALPDDEITQTVRQQASERLGLGAEDAEFRFVVAGDVRQGTELHQELMVFAAQRGAIDARVELLRSIGLEPAAIGVGPCALFRGFERFLRREEDRGQVSALLDVGYSATRVVISRGAELIFFRSLPIGGRLFDEQVGDHLDLSLAEASDLRMTLRRQCVAALTGQLAPDADGVGESTQRAVLDALRAPLDQLGKELQLCLRYCSATFRGIGAGTVTVVGGEACNTDMLRLLSDRLNLPFQIGRPIRNIHCDGDFDGADWRTGKPEWATAVGLAFMPTQHLAEVQG
jgi:type IV pilus assembly protein PilM